MVYHFLASKPPIQTKRKAASHGPSSCFPRCPEAPGGNSHAYFVDARAHGALGLGAFGPRTRLELTHGSALPPATKSASLLSENQVTCCFDRARRKLEGPRPGGTGPSLGEVWQAGRHRKSSLPG